MCVKEVWGIIIVTNASKTKVIAKNQLYPLSACCRIPKVSIESARTYSQRRAEGYLYLDQHTSLTTPGWLLVIGQTLNWVILNDKKS